MTAVWLSGAIGSSRCLILHAHAARRAETLFKGRHQLEWSKGLRERLGLGREATDEDLAVRQEAPAIWLGRLTLDEWRLVLWGEARGAVLAAVMELVGVLRLNRVSADRRLDSAPAESYTVPRCTLRYPQRWR